MKRMFVVFGIIFLGIRAADLPDEPNKFDITRIDYSTLFRRSGLKNDPTSIIFYLEEKNQEALQQFIVQAKKDGRIDVLEKALDYAVKGKKRNAVNILLAEGTPILESLLKQTVDFFLKYDLMDQEERQHYVDAERIFSRIIQNIIENPSRKAEFNTLVKYLMQNGNKTFLRWLLGVAIELRNIPYVEQLMGQGVFIFGHNRLQNAIQILTVFKNHQVNDTDKKRIQTIIDKLIEGYERNNTQRENVERRGQ